MRALHETGTETPAVDLQQAWHRPPSRHLYLANKIALGQIDSGIAGGTDTTSDAPLAIGDKLRKKLMVVNAAETTRLVLLHWPRSSPPTLGWRFRAMVSRAPGCPWAIMPALTALEWRITREAQDELAVASHKNLAAAYERGFQDDLITAFRGLERDQNLRADSSVEKLATLKPVFGKGEAATMTAANSTPLTDGASAVLLASESGPRSMIFRFWPISLTVRDGRS
ncbi:MAG: hypothetical protein R2693_07635 [Nocardioidaceae bacterium]